MSHTLESETAILPWVIADNVVREVEIHVSGPLADREELIDKLSDQADAHYNADAKFRARVKRNNTWGRDWHYCFMRHWLCGLRPDLRLPASFANGEPLR